jgi:hypothetical protein
VCRLLLALFYALNMEATFSSDTFVLTFKFIMHYNPTDNNVTTDIKLQNKAIYILSIPISSRVEINKSTCLSLLKISLYRNFCVGPTSS